MGVQGSLGHFITAIQVFKLKGEHHMYFATLGPGEGCWVPAQTQRPFQLIYINEKINSLNEHHVSGIESCDDR